MFVSMNGADGLRAIPGTALSAIGTHLVKFGWAPDSAPASGNTFVYEKKTESGNSLNLVYRVSADTRSHSVVIRVVVSGKGAIPPECVTVLKGSLAAAVFAVEKSGHRVLETPDGHRG